MPDVEIAAAPIGVDVEIVLQTLRIIGANDDHRLVRPVVLCVRKRVRRDELESAREPSPQFHGERVVARVSGALKQIDASKTGNRAYQRVTQHRERCSCRIGHSGWYGRAKIDVARAADVHAAEVQVID